MRGKELGIEGVREGFELRKDTTILPAQDMKKTEVMQKSFIASHRKSLCAFVWQKVCGSWVRVKKKKLRVPCVRKS